MRTAGVIKGYSQSSCNSGGKACANSTGGEVNARWLVSVSGQEVGKKKRGRKRGRSSLFRVLQNSGKESEAWGTGRATTRHRHTLRNTMKSKNKAPRYYGWDTPPVGRTDDPPTS